MHSKLNTSGLRCTTQMRNADPDLTHKMKCYHEKNKVFVQQPVLDSQLCAYRHFFFYNDRHKRVEQTEIVTEKGERITRKHTAGSEQSDGLERRHTKTNHQTGGAGVLLVSY